MQLLDISDHHKTQEGYRDRPLPTKASTEWSGKQFGPRGGRSRTSPSLPLGEVRGSGHLASALASSLYPRRYGHAGATARAALTVDLPSQVPLRRPDLGRGEKVLRPGRVQPPAGLRPRGGMARREPPSGPPVDGEGHPRPLPAGRRAAAGLMDKGP